MVLTEVLGILIFSIGYVFITLEHKTKINKSAVAILMGVLLWILVSLAGIAGIEESLLETGAEIFELVVFLFAAMALVEVLIDYNFFDYIRYKLFKLKIDERRQFLIIASLTFILSAVIDNLTTTIVMTTISLKFFRKENILPVIGAVVISANAGGAFSPIGDVTTIMLWLEDKFSAFEVVKYGILPSLAIFLVALAMIYRKVKSGFFEVGYDVISELSKKSKLVIGLVFVSFAMSLVMHTFGLPPYLGLLLGLSIVWIVSEYLNTKEKHLKTSIEREISSSFKRTDIVSRLFFIGVLLAVSALNMLGVLEKISHIVYGEIQSVSNIIVGNVILGVISAVLDNVPLTAIAIDILKTSDVQLWVLLAIAVGTGGSLLVIGSAAGVIAMGMVKDLTFFKYFKIAFVPALLSYLVGVLVWYIQYIVIT